MLEPWQKQGVSSHREDALTENSSNESPPQPLPHDDLDLLEFDGEGGETIPLPTPWWRHRWVPILSGIVLVERALGARLGLCRSPLYRSTTCGADALISGICAIKRISYDQREKDGNDDLGDEPGVHCSRPRV